jgi:hypothetical protein
MTVVYGNSACPIGHALGPKVVTLEGAAGAGPGNGATIRGMISSVTIIYAQYRFMLTKHSTQSNSHTQRTKRRASPSTLQHRINLPIVSTEPRTRPRRRKRSINPSQHRQTNSLSLLHIRRVGIHALRNKFERLCEWGISGSQREEYIGLGTVSGLLSLEVPPEFVEELVVVEVEVCGVLSVAGYEAVDVEVDVEVAVDYYIEDVCLGWKWWGNGRAYDYDGVSHVKQRTKKLRRGKEDGGEEGRHWSNEPSVPSVADAVLITRLIGAMNVGDPVGDDSISVLAEIIFVVGTSEAEMGSGTTVGTVDAPVDRAVDGGELPLVLDPYTPQAGK